MLSIGDSLDFLLVKPGKDCGAIKALKAAQWRSEDKIFGLKKIYTTGTYEVTALEDVNLEVAKRDIGSSDTGAFRC